MKVHLLDDWYDVLRALPSFALLDGHEVTVHTDRYGLESETAEALAGADAVVLFRDRTAITESLADRLAGVRLVAMRGQHDHVDHEALARNGVTFCSFKGAEGPSVSTAELAFGQIIAALRYLPEQIASARAGRWQADAPLGRGVRGKRLGLYGYGSIARVVAGYGLAFGMELSVWGSDAARDRARADGLDVPADRMSFFAGADVVSIHKRSVAATKGEVTEADLMAMRPGSVLVNTSRAALIAPGAVPAALEAGRIGRAAFDVFEDEPLLDPADPVLAHPHVMPTPHVGFVTAENLDAQFTDIYGLIAALAAGRPEHVIGSGS